MKAARRRTAPPGTRQAIFDAAARAFSARGFDGVGVDRIARAAGVNKAMIYYHFADKLALYREVVGDLMQVVGRAVAALAESELPPARKLDGFIERVVQVADERPWFPPMMLREIAEGAPHLDRETLSRLRAIIGSFSRILAEGHAAGVFRPVNPILAYMSIVGPLLFNAARERVAERHGDTAAPMLVSIPRADLVAHLQLTARRMLEKP
jgi:AcrR family transcriptional regulator